MLMEPRASPSMGENASGRGGGVASFCAIFRLVKCTVVISVHLCFPNSTENNEQRLTVGPGLEMMTSVMF